MIGVRALAAASGALCWAAPVAVAQELPTPRACPEASEILVERRLEGNARFVAIDRAVAEQGLKIVTLLRLSPVFPFNLLNYSLGLTRVRLVDYVLACFGMLPGTLLYVYYGRLAGDVAALASGVASDRDAAYWVVLGLGLVATIAVTTIVTRIARRALGEIGES